MKIKNNDLKKISVFEIAQHTQKQRTLYNTVNIETTNKARDNAQNVFKLIKRVYKL